MSEKGCNIMRRINLAVLLCLFVGIGASRAQDARELVRLPKPMQEHMLGNMRDHLATLNEIIGDVADDKFNDAAKITEQRFGDEFTQPPWRLPSSAVFPKTDAGHRDEHASRVKSIGHRVAKRIRHTDGGSHA